MSALEIQADARPMEAAWTGWAPFYCDPHAEPQRAAELRSVFMLGADYLRRTIMADAAAGSEERAARWAAIEAELDPFGASLRPEPRS